MDTEQRNTLVDLLRTVGPAHHQAYIDTDGVDPDWPIWYAEYLQAPLAELLGLDFTRSQLVYCLMDADTEYRARASESDWPEFYADLILEHCARSATPAEDKLSLYHFDGCPFCAMVRSAIGELGLDIELRSIVDDPQNREDLVEARGRATVPVLRITSPDGEERWMPESRDIVHYLEGLK